MNTLSATLAPRFLGRAGERFLTVGFPPPGEARGHVIYLPPLGEEMNRCRALAAAQSRRLAAAGYRVTLVDFFGTGDSEGELQDASLAIWRDNIDETVRAALEETEAPVTLWGLRFGALLAMDYAAGANRPIENLLLWEPVTSGKRYVTQLLRQRVASLVGKDLPPETTQEIRARLAAGEPVEISGYRFGGELIGDIEAIEPGGRGRLCQGSIFWLENTPQQAPDISTGSKRIVGSLQEGGDRVEVRLFHDPPIWQLHKRDDAPQLVDLSTGLLA